MLILASNSPRRKELLSMLGYTFEVRPADCDESTHLTNPKRVVKELSKRKAKAVACAPTDTIIGSDTVVAIGKKILGKPRDEADAFQMLSLLSGHTHTVHTGVTVLQGERAVTKCISCKVTFKKMTEQEICDYIATKEPMDKAGAYGIQGKASAYISKVHGDYFAVVGFPCSCIDSILSEFGIKKGFNIQKNLK